MPAPYRVNRARLLSSSLCLAAAPYAIPRALAAQPAPALETAGTANDTAGLLFYAADMGFYQSAGLRVSVTALGNSGALSSAIASGAIQIGSFAISIGALARERGLPLTMIAPAGLYLSTTPASGLIVATNSTIRKAADCNGKTIATRDLSNMSYFGAKAWLDKNGGDSKSVRWIEIPDTSTVAAILAGRIDAATISEPALDDALRGGAVRSLGSVFDAIGKRFLISGYFTTEQFAAAHPDVVRRFAAVMGSTATWANKNHAATAKILEKYVQAPVAPDSLRVTYAERLLAADVQPVLDVLLDYGFLKTPMRARELFSPFVTA